MIVRDNKGNELLDIIYVDEDNADMKYEPINHCLAVVKIENDYLMGWNKWRQEWEIFGGCREDNETLKECIVRECQEELGLTGVDYEYLGLMYFKIAPGYFNSKWHYEYGGLYGDEGVDDMKVGCFRASLLFSAFWDCSVSISTLLCL